jgi:hypothetical protein
MMRMLIINRNIKCSAHDAGITFIIYTQGQNISKPNKTGGTLIIAETVQELY